MPTIEINEVDNTLYGMSESTSDNIVLIPGTATTGPLDPTICTSVIEFKNKFGPRAPKKDNNIFTSWDYAVNLLTLGFPVMYKRITEDIDGKPLVAKASSNIESPGVSLINSSSFSVTLADNVLSLDYTSLVDIGSLSLTILANGTSGVDSKIFECVKDSIKTGQNSIKIGLSTPGGSDEPAPLADEEVTDPVDSGTTESNPPAEGTDTENPTPETPVTPTETPTVTADYYLEPSLFTDGNYQIKVNIIGTNVVNPLFQDLLATFTKTGTDITNFAVQNVPHKVAEITAKYGGTYGNSLTYSIDVTESAYYLRVYYDKYIVDSAKIASTADTSNLIEKLYHGLSSIQLNTVNVFVTAPLEQFTLSECSRIKLSGGTDVEESKVPDILPTVYKEFDDKLIYNVKFITSGGYTDSGPDKVEIATAMVELAESRKDCVAILDVPINLPEDEVTRFFRTLNSSYAVAYAPWSLMRLVYDRSEKWCSPSYQFLQALTKSVNSGNPIYMPPAGVQRALLSNIIKTEYQIGSALSKDWQSDNPQSINPIMMIYPYGYTIFGQRTLYSVEDTSLTGQRSALQELSVRLVGIEIKRLIWRTAMYLTFCHNNLYTWNQFRSQVVPQLESMKANGGIVDFRVRMNEDTTTAQDINENRIRGQVVVSVSHAAEDFLIDFVMEQSSVTFEDDTTVAVGELSLEQAYR